MATIPAEVAELPTKAAKIRHLRQAKWEIGDIARALGISYQHAYNVLKRSGASPPVKQPIQHASPLVEKLAKIAESEGVEPQRLFDEALSDFIEKKRRGSARPHVLSAYEESIKTYDVLYRQLAK